MELMGQPENGLADSAARHHPRTTVALSEFMSHGWRRRSGNSAAIRREAEYAQDRRARLSLSFAGDRLVVPAGCAKIRSNDVPYPFRAHSVFAHLTGLGSQAEPDSVLVIDIDACVRHEAVLFMSPAAGPGTEAFYRDAVRGEYTIGPRHSLREVAEMIGIDVRPLDELPGVLLDGVRRVRVVRGASDTIDELVEGLRRNNADDLDAELRAAADELRLVKDAWEIGELARAVDVTVTAFEDVVRAIPRAQTVPRGERVVEATFFARARTFGHDVGYGTTSAAGNNATNLHWSRADGPVRTGDLLLVDGGVEMDSLYTADVTRTIPISGSFSSVQTMVYEAVLEAADAAFEVATVGRPFQDAHDAAVSILAQNLHDWGLLPVGVAVSLSDAGQHHRRWMLHATSHHLGLDVHDCAQARHEFYRGAVIRPGMVFTIEPGLYFKEDDELVPPELRGIGVRIEDDVLATEGGPVNLSAALPRTVDEVERWMGPLLAEGELLLNHSKTQV